MSQFFNSGNITAGGSMFANLSVWDEDRSDLFSPRFNWNYQQRGPRSARAQLPWIGLWPSSRMAQGDPTQVMSYLGTDCQMGGNWDEPLNWDTGSMHLYGFSGQCLDVNSNPVQNAAIMCFLTATDALAGTTFSDNNGNYQVTTPYAGQQHYITAQLAGTTDIFGTTDFTLVPTLV